MDPIKVIIVDDHQIVRDGINALLLGVQDIKIIGEAADSEELFELMKKNIPDVMILDLGLPTLSGVEITEIVKSEHPEVKVIIFTGYPENEALIKSLQAGATGILPKNTSRHELLASIYKVHSGETHFSETVSNNLLKSFINKSKPDESAVSKNVKLTERENEIIRLFAEGKSYKEIGATLYISPRTVETHKNNIMQKLQLKTTVDMVKYAIKEKLVEI